MRAVLDKAALFKHCNYSPHPGQQAIHDAGPHDGGGARHRVVCAGARFGKSHCAAFELVAAALAPNDRETTWWVVAPLANLANICFRSVVSILTQHFPANVIKVSETDGLIVGRNLLGVEFRVHRRTTERGIVALTGSTVDGMILDESSAIPDEIWESSLSSRLLSTNGWTLSISSPRGVGGWWANMFRAGQRGSDPEVWSMRAPTSMSPLIAPAELAALKARLPDTVYRETYEAELIARSGRVFDPELVEASAVGDFEEPIPGVEYHAGLDLAATTDRTVLTVARRDEGKMRVVWVDTIAPGLEWAAIVERCARNVRRYNDCSIRADATGSGQPVVEMLRNADLTVQAFVFTAQNKQALVRHGQLLLERGVILPRRDLAPTVEEMILFQWLDERGERCGAPSGSHDDAVASWLLCAKSFPASPEAAVGRAFVKGQDVTILEEPETVEPPKVVETPAPTAEEVSGGEDSEMIRKLKKLAAEAARRAKEEQLRLVRATHPPAKGKRGDDHEPRHWTSPGGRRKLGGPFDLGVDVRGD